jgi:hypothetical protein
VPILIPLAPYSSKQRSHSPMLLFWNGLTIARKLSRLG